MVVLEGALSVVAYVSVIVATLRAGSRALYLTEHDSIGVLQGPEILGPHDVQNRSDASPVWDLSYPFEMGVRLALFPEAFDYEQDEEPETTEPYTMMPQPQAVFKTDVNEDIEDNDTAELDDLVEQVLSDSEEYQGKLSFLHQYVPTTSMRWSWNLMRSSVSKSVAAAKVWTPSRMQWKFWQKDQGGVDVEDEDLDNWDDEEEWDYVSKRLADVDFRGVSGGNVTAHIAVHAPETFSDLRSRFGISEADFEASMLKAGPFISFQSNSKGAARMGGVFFFTRDGAYMVKTIKKTEAGAFLKMLPKYHKHMRRNGRKSLLTRFCGMYTVKLTRENTGGVFSSTKEEEHVFVIMNSVFPAEGSQFITERYDLKGSTVGRECSEEEKVKKGNNAVLKDLDLAREVETVKSAGSSSRRPTGYGFHLGPTNKAALLSQLRRDVKLLIECQVMDYSLLVGVVNMDSGRFDVGALTTVENQEAIFRRLANSKKGARKLKTLTHAVLNPLQSICAPVIYFARRTLRFSESTLSTVLTLPLPYYGAGSCGVDGGGLAMVDGSRTGKRALFYMGLIDFLQPWTARKVVERQLKGLIGYDIHAISCVSPEEYASRFLEFIDSHVS